MESTLEKSEARGFTEDEWRAQILNGEARCCDCLRRYGDEFGFPDLVIPHHVWEQISPQGDEGGLLCPSCICQRLHAKGIRCEGAFMSGPIVSVSQQTIWLLNRVRSLEQRLEQIDPKFN